MRFGFVPNPFALPYLAALDRGYFDEEGVILEALSFANGSRVAAALSEGRIDCGVGGHLQTLGAVVGGDDQVFISPLAFEAPPDHLAISLVVGKVALRSARDLEGKTVACSARGAISELQLRILMDAAGGDYRAVNVAVMPFASMEEALRRGEIAAASVVEPFAAQMAANGTGRVFDRGSLSTALKAGERCMITGVVAKRGWIERDRSAAQAVVRAMQRGIAFLLDDERAARRMMAGYGGMPPAKTEEARLPAFFPDLRRSDLQLAFDLAAKFGLVPRVVDAREMIDLLPIGSLP